MKITLATMTAIAILAAVALVLTPMPFERLAAGADEYRIFCRKTSCDGVDVGYGKIVKCSAENLENTLLKCAGIDGISAKFKKNGEWVENLLAKLKFCAKDVRECGGTTVVCGYSPLIKGGIVVDGVKINLQVAYGQGAVVMGYPLIMEGY